MVLYYHVTQYRNYPTLKQIFYPRSFRERHFRSLLYPAHHTKPNIGSKNIIKGNDEKLIGGGHVGKILNDYTILIILVASQWNH